MDLPSEMAVTYIEDISAYSSLLGDFRTALNRHGVTVTGRRGEATAVLRIHEDESERRVLTVDRTGKVQEYEIRQSIRFDVIATDSRPVVSEQTVSLSRDFVFIRTDVLGKEREEQLVREELQRDLVNTAMLRIAAASRETIR